jgi:NAD-dependent deacetylase
MIDVTRESLECIRPAAEIFLAARQVVVLTGAGISTHSGIRDFRSPGSGLWTHYDPIEVASLDSFRYKPEDFFKWIHPLVVGIQDALPNAAHLALARLENHGYINTIITQNVDGLHQRAGSKNILEIHGSMRTMTCVSCFHKYDSSEFIAAYLKHDEIPKCKRCSHILKPDVILFGEQLPARTWLKAQEVCKQCDLMIVAGSSLEVLPVASLPMRAIENGAHTIIINNSVTYLDVRADVVFNDDVANILPLIAKEVLHE